MFNAGKKITKIPEKNSNLKSKTWSKAPFILSRCIATSYHEFWWVITWPKLRDFAMVFDDTFLCVSAIACFVSGELCFKQCACYKCASVVTLSERALPNARCTFSQNLNDPIRIPYVGDLNLIIARVPFHIDTRSGQFFFACFKPL